MKTPPITLLRSVLLIGAVCALALTACSANTAGKTSTGGTSTTGGGTATAQPQPTKTKPTSLPTITVAYCQSLLSISESNQIMNPANPTTAIDVSGGGTGGACSYDYAPFKANLFINFESWNGPTPIPQQDIVTFLTRLTHSPNGTVKTFTQVSGVGDQAAFLAATAVGGSITYTIDAFYALYGKILFACDNIFIGAAPSDATEQAKLQQCAETVVSRL